jgi:hypothetical protein
MNMLCGAGVPARETPGAGTEKGNASAILTAIIGSFTLLAAVLHEIFDESAYERFLLRHQLTSSAAAYSTFCRERDLSRARRPRCC